MKKRSFFVTSVFFLMLALNLPARPAISDPEARNGATRISSGNTNNDPVLPINRLRDPDGNGNEGSAESCCEKLMSAKRSIYYLNDWSYKMAFQLRGIYTRDETMFFCLGICNHSHINYSVDSIRFYIADEKKAGKSQTRGTALVPVCVYGNTRIIRGKTREFCVFALQRFTLPEKKLLVIDVSERNGGRHLQLQANNSTLVKARLI